MPDCGGQCADDAMDAYERLGRVSEAASAYATALGILCRCRKTSSGLWQR